MLGEYGYSLRNVIAILDPQAARPAASASAAQVTQKPRQLKRYKNPHNDEVVEAKGGNHKVLKEWMSKYGAEVVESWQA